MRNHKQKVAVIGLKGLPAFGGAAAVGENIILKLKDQFDFTVLSISSHTEKKTGYLLGYYQKVFHKIPFRRLNTLIYYIKSAIYVLFNNFDLIHLHHRDASFIIPLLRLKYPVVLTTHGMVLTDKWKRYKMFFNLQDRLFLGFASVITTVSMKDYDIVADFIRRRKKQLAYIPNGVSIHEIQYEHKDHIVFAAARIIPNKGVHLLLEAVSSLKLAEKVLIIGDLGQMSTYSSNIRSMASSLSNVEFVDLIKDKKELFSIIGSAKFFVYPSLIESMSMMMLEVASLGTPMICSRIRENEDIFNDSEVLFFEAGNSKDLAEKIEWANSNPYAMAQLAENSRKKLYEKYLWSDIANQYAKVFSKLIN
jgi:glycosyltransferase involved in cell wall biosynthesis